MSRYEFVPDTQVGSRFLWLVAVPAGFGFGAWAMLFVVPGDAHPLVRGVVAGLLPLVGMLAVVCYRQITRDPVRLWPYGPFAFAAVVFAGAMIQLVMDALNDPNGAPIPIVAVGVGFLQPFLAVAGGLLSFIAVGRRAAGLME